jgi:hypothetical protein
MIVRSDCWLTHVCLISILFTGIPRTLEAADATPTPAAVKRSLIVAPREFHSALAPYVEHKLKQLPTSLVTLEDALKESGGDDPERLKQFLFKKWKEKGLSYVLLVGDADVMPVRYVTLDRIQASAFDYAFYPSDLYYGDLTKEDGAFDDWNAQKDSFHAGYFGEVRGEKNKSDKMNFDEVDYYPEASVGRWPVSTVKEVEIVVEKTIRYELAVLEGKKPGMRRVALVSVGGWVDTRSYMDRRAERLAPVWEIEKMYYADKRRDDGFRSPTFREIRKVLNEGVGLAFHAGHGLDDRWEQCFTLKTLERVRNADRLPVMFSAGCSSGRIATLPPYEAYTDCNGIEHRGTMGGEVFAAPPPPPAAYQRGANNPTGLGEQLLRGGPDGAVAYIGCNTGSQPCALTLMQGFSDAIAKSKDARLGDCWNEAVEYYYDREDLEYLRPTRRWYTASVFFQAMKFMMYGDPSLVLPNAEKTEPTRKTGAESAEYSARSS